MSRQRKKSKAVPVVLVITILVAALAVGCFLVKPMITDPLRKSSADNLVKQQNEAVAQNQEIMAEYNAAILELQNQREVQPSNPAWPEHKSEGWDVIDLTNYPLENQTAVTSTRADLMANGMLLLNCSCSMNGIPAPRILTIRRSPALASISAETKRSRWIITTSPSSL